MATLSGACAGAPRTPQKVHVQAARYLASSVLALACDTAIYLALGIAGMVPALAAAAGYLAGLALHYMLSIHFVFDVEATGKGRLPAHPPEPGYPCCVSALGELAWMPPRGELPPLYATSAASVAARDVGRAG